ncbi:MAG TPA: glycine cleavage T C-terminal barrel domain-containing protein [Longimicrobiaceae bacterium]|nr:glycine cleavage T C-terminal barrel domain-containing protein [Longimicrobiaceae bacterium]
MSAGEDGLSGHALLDRQAEAGGTIVPFAGSAVVRHYGDAEAEYRAIRRAAGIVLRSELGLVRMSGRDPVRMLNGLITNDLSKAGPGRAVYGAMLTPKARIITDLRAMVRSGEVLFDFPLAALEALTTHLRKYVPPLFARWEVIAGASVIGVYGPRSADLLSGYAAESLGTDEDAVATLNVAGVEALAVATGIAGGERGYDLLVAGPGGDAVWSALLDAGAGIGVAPAGFAALETLRIEAGRPRFGQELTEETLPPEAYETTGSMARAVSFTKGCYTGQEVVIRIAHRGHVNRSLRGLRLGGAPTPPERTPLFRVDDGKEIGWVTSAAHSPQEGETVALGYVRREMEVGARVRVGGERGAEAEICELPFTRRGTGDQPKAADGGSGGRPTGAP